MSSPEAEAPPEEEAAPARDEAREELLGVFTDALGDAVLEHHIKPGDDLWIRVTPDAWTTAGETARYAGRCNFFDFLSAIDWLPSPFGRDMDSEVDTLVHGTEPKDPGEMQHGCAGGETRFQVFARVAPVAARPGVTLKVDVPEDTLTLDSWVPVYVGATWHERETWEMYGVTFAGHPYLRHIYLPGEFEGFPCRKDFPLLARKVKPWPGIVDVEPLPGGGDDEGDGDGESGGDA